MNARDGKDRPSAVTPRRPTENNSTRQANSSSKDYSNTSETQRPQGFVESFLPHGEEHAIDTPTLVRLVKCKSVRDLQKLIAFERASGALILSTGAGGYYLPDDGLKGKLELAAFVHTLNGRASNTFAAMRAAKRALAYWPEEDEAG